MRQRLQDWLAETHGTRFELTRHFLGRFFDSDLVATQGEWLKVAIGVFSMVSCAWVMLAQILIYKYRELAKAGMMHRRAEEARADEATLIALAMCCAALLIAVLWQSLFPSLRDYLALASLPIRSSEIFTAKFTALLIVFAIFTPLLNLPISLVFHAIARTPTTFGPFVAISSGCAIAFFGLIALQGAMLNFLPPRWFERASLWTQALVVTTALGAFPFLAWKPSIAAAIRPSSTATLIAIALAPVMYLLTFHRHRPLVVEARATSRTGFSLSFGFLKRLTDVCPTLDPRQLAALSFIWKTLSRGRVQRLSLLVYVGLGIAWTLKFLISFLAESGARPAGADRFLLATAPLTLTLFVLFGLRHMFSMPAELKANWMFQITEREGRLAWLTAVERFVLFLGLAPVILLGAVFIGFYLGPLTAVAWGFLSFVLAASLFEYVFRDWRKLPFTCSYLPGKRPILYTVALYIALMPALLPVGIILLGAASNPAAFLVLLTLEFILWWQLRRARLSTWARFPLRYEEQPEVEVDQYQLSGDGTTVAQEHFQREWGEFLRNPGDMPILSPLDPYESRLDRIRRWMRAMPGDLQYAARVLARSPGFALSAALTLGLGLGLNTAFFTVFNAFVLKPAAVRDPQSLVSIELFARDGRKLSLPLRDFDVLRSNAGALSDGVASSMIFTGLDGRPAIGFIVSSAYFSVLGAGVPVGRSFQPGEAERVVVLSHRAWENRFAREPGIVGRVVDIHNHKFTVTGIAAPEFNGLEKAGVDFWVPLEVWNTLPNVPIERNFQLLGRLRSGVTQWRAQLMLVSLARQLTEDRDPSDRVYRVQLESKDISIPWVTLQYFVPFLIAFGVTLLIPCANAANLMLARAMARHREIGIRLALGASRGRIVRQLLAEGLLIAILGGLAGLAIARGALDFCVRMIYATAPPAVLFRFPVPDLVLDLRVFVYMLAVAAATTLVFALPPAAQATRASLSLRSYRLRDALIVGQVAVCAMLVVIAGVLIHNGQRQAEFDLGYNADSVFAAAFETPGGSMALRGVLEQAPWVESIAFMASPPTSLPTIRIAAVNRSNFDFTYFNFVSPEYFNVLRIPIIAGRTFTREEAANEAPVALITKAAAGRLWPGQNPLGQSIAIELPQRRIGWLPRFHEARVVGVTGDIMGHPLTGYGRPVVHFPTTLRPDRYGANIVRGKGNEDLTRRLFDADMSRHSLSNQGGRVIALQEAVDWVTYPQRAASWLSSLLGGLALLLTVTGMYGVMSYLVSQRTREIGIRIAIGATRLQVVRFILSYSTKLSLLGLGIGVTLALGVSQYFSSTIGTFMNVYDLAAYLLAPVVVALSALLAALVPARRASTIDPLCALKIE
jgi:predicted permease